MNAKCACVCVLVHCFTLTSACLVPLAQSHTDSMCSLESSITQRKAPASCKQRRSKTERRERTSERAYDRWRDDAAQSQIRTNVLKPVLVLFESPVWRLGVWGSSIALVR